MTEDVGEQYATADNLQARIALHAAFSLNPHWAEWLRQSLATGIHHHEAPGPDQLPKALAAATNDRMTEGTGAYGHPKARPRASSATRKAYCKASTVAVGTRSPTRFSQRRSVLTSVHFWSWASATYSAA